MSDINQKLKELQDVEIEAEYCIDCDLYKNRNLPVIGRYSYRSLSHKPNIVIVMTHPSSLDNSCGKIASGTDGIQLKGWLETAGVDMADVSILSCTKCFVKEREISNHQLLMCAKYLYKQVNIIQPDLIIAMGKAPAHVFVQQKTPEFEIARGTKTNIGGFRSKVWPVSTPLIDGIEGIQSLCIVTFHIYRLTHIFKNELYAEEDANLVRTFLEANER